MENNIRLEDLHSTYQQIARVIGIENAVKLGGEFGGEQFYLPKIDVCLARIRARKIIEDFKGGNYLEMARKYGVTSNYVRQLIKKRRRERVSNAG